MDRKKETVIVVHGTFSAKNDNGSPNWYAPNQTFCKQLDEELKRRHCNARCWAHLKPGEDFFHWDGRNDWLSRAKATSRLRNEIKRLKSEGYIVHLVGHSHGGNIILDATTDDIGETQAWLNGRAVLFGTPIYQNNWTYRERRRRQLLLWLGLSFLFWVALGFYTLSGFNPLAAFSTAAATDNIALFVAVAFVLATLYLVLSSVGAFKLQTDSTQYRWSPAFLAINSASDEAYRSLAGLGDSENPFFHNNEKDPPPNSIFSGFAQVLESSRSSLAGKIRRTFNISNIQSAVIIAALLCFLGIFWRPIVAMVNAHQISDAGLSLTFLITITLIVVIACFFRRQFFHGLLLPGSVLSNAIPIIKNTGFGLLMVAFGTMAKKAAWGILKAISLGISGAPRRPDDISVSLEPSGDNFYLELPKAVVDGVKQQQQPQLNHIQELLYAADIKWSPGELREQLEGIDFPLVHTVYYRNTECVKKAADWITEPVLEFLDGYDATKSGGDYRNHIGRLELRISSPGSIWREALSESEVTLAAMKCGLTQANPEKLQAIISGAKSEIASRIPYPQPRESTLPHDSEAR